MILGLFQVTGSKNEDQVLNAIEAYTEFRPELAHRAINQLFDIARIQHCSQLLRALQVWCLFFKIWVLWKIWFTSLVVYQHHTDFCIMNFLSFLQLVIVALKCHKYDKSIQVTGSAALFYLTNTEYRSDQSVGLRREVIQVVLNGMEQYQEVTVSLFLTSDKVPFCYTLKKCKVGLDLGLVLDSNAHLSWLNLPT